MKAVLLVPETERIGLTGKPLINQQGIVGSLKGSFQAGQRATLSNLRGLSQKLAEAQRAINGAENNIQKANDNIDDIHNTSTSVSQALNDYWERWDTHGVHDEFNNVQFLSTAVNMDKVRTSMLGESVDPAVISTNDYLPRGLYWDPVFAWKSHTLQWERNDELTDSFSSRKWPHLPPVTIDSLFNLTIANLAATATEFGLIVAAVIVQQQATLAAGRHFAAMTSLIGPAPASYLANEEILWTLSGAMITIRSTITKDLITLGLLVAAASAIQLVVAALAQQIKDYKHVELMGQNPGYYEGSPIQRDTLHESWFTYAYIDTLTVALLEAAGQAALYPLHTITINTVSLAAQTVAYALSMNALHAIPDLIILGVPAPNPAFTVAALAASAAAEAIWAKVNADSFVKASYVKNFVAYAATQSYVFMFNVTRVNNNHKVELNTKPTGSDGTNKNHLINVNGKMDSIAIEGWTTNIAKITSALSSLSIGEMVQGVDYFADKDSSREYSGYVRAGSSTRYDTYIFSKLRNDYIDWFNMKVNSNKWTLPIGSIAGTGTARQVFYGGSPVRLESNGSGDLVCWSHVFNKNIFNIRAAQIGNRNIEKTIIIKTKYEYSNGIYRAFTALVKCSSSNKLWLLMERDMQRFYSGSGADVMMAEQVIYNFDPKNYGDFFTTNRAGKISEVFYYTFDGHIVSCRPGLVVKDNYLLGEFVNREVKHYDDFVYTPQSPWTNGEGDYTSYENIYF